VKVTLGPSVARAQCQRGSLRAPSLPALIGSTGARMPTHIAKKGVAEARRRSMSGNG
jgi:hypothetical protein